jgi:Ca2+-binding RTX toxin-like protein
MAIINGTPNNDTLLGGSAADSISGLAGADSITAGAGNDTILGGAGNDIIDGGSGFNRYVVIGTADAYSWAINANSQLILTDEETNSSNLLDGTNEGVDTLRNIQVIEYRLPDGTKESEFQVDDFSNAVDAGNYQIQYGVWVNGRSNYFGDQDYFKLQTTSGQKVVLSGSTGGGAHLSESPNSYSIQGQYAYIGGDREFTWSATNNLDILAWSNNLNLSSPMASAPYSFVFRRAQVGTDAAERLVAGDIYEHLTGGLGNDTLVGSARSDYLNGGADNDLITGGSGNDVIDGGEGAVNIATFTGNKSDYNITWDGGNLSIRVADAVAGRDGVDQLINTQILRFADGDVVLDAESNVATSVGAVSIGQSMSGSLPITADWREVDVDYFQQKFSADISTNTTLRLTIARAKNVRGYLNLQFLFQGSTEALTFTNLSNNSAISHFNFDYGVESSWIIKPLKWGASTDFLAVNQRADIKVWGVATDNVDILSSDLDYTIRLDRVLVGTLSSDTLLGDGVSGYIDAGAGADLVTGSAMDEEIVGGAGDDTINGGDGNDKLVDSVGRNILNGGAGDDTIDISGATTPKASIDGGSGVDTLKIASDTNWTDITVSGVEILDGNNGRITLSPEQVIDKGFTAAQNITFRLAPSLSSGGTLDASNLAGSFNLRGTNQSDTLIGNSSNNIIHLQSDENVGPGYAVDTVIAGDGDDTIAWQTSSWREWYRFFSDFDATTRSYQLSGFIDGGSGEDKLSLNFGENYWYHSNGNTFNQENSLSWNLDLSGLVLQGIESLQILGYDPNRFWAFPTEFTLSVDQINSLSSTSGLTAVSIVGGGDINLARLASLGISTWRFGDSSTYNILGTSNAETIALGSGSINVDLGGGADEIVIDGKALVVDTINGGAGVDILTIRGTDVDLSGATLSNIESIKVSSQSLSMTADQWTNYGGLVVRVPGATTGYILSAPSAGTSTLASDSQYVGLTGSSGDDILIGNARDNILVGGTGNDNLVGNAGNDRLVSGAGIDVISGGAGDDTVVINGKTAVRDQIDGGSGIDTLQVSNGQDLTTANISNIEILKGTGTVTLSATQLSGFTEIQGLSVQLNGSSTSFNLGTTKIGTGAAVLLPTADALASISSGAVIGSKGDDTIIGGASADLVNGGRGGDVLAGGSGNDTLVGGSGLDTLSGDAGDDTFLVETSEFSGGSYQQVTVAGLFGNVGNFDGRSRVVYADAIDGGTGVDSISVSMMDSSAYVINAGRVANLETINIQSISGENLVALDASLFSDLSTFNVVANPNRYDWITLGISGHKENLDLGNIAADAKIREIRLEGSFYDIDASDFVLGPDAWAANTWDLNGVDRSGLRVSSFNALKLSSGNDGVRIYGDNQFTVDAGAGNDYIKLYSISTLRASIDGGTGNDVLDLENLGFIDLSAASLANIDTVKYGSSTLVVSSAQLEGMSFDGSGKKFTKVGSAIVGTNENDSYQGQGSGSFQGGKGNDTISNVSTAVFTGNYNDYDFTRSGDTLTIQQARGTLADGTDTVSGVMNLQFADTNLKIDDAPNESNFSNYLNSSSNWDSLTHAEYGKAVSGKKDFGSDTDLFAATLAPNSPIAITGSTLNGSGWNMSFWDAATGQSIQFKSLVHGSVNWGWYSSWMNAAGKWLPGFSTSDGFKPYEGGDVVVRMSVDGAIQDYAFTLNYLDDYAGSVATLGRMDAQTGVVKGYIGDINDADWIRTDLIAGTKYEFSLKGLSSGGGTLVDPKLLLLNSAGRLIESGVDLVSNTSGYDDTIVYRPTVSGTFYLSATDIAGVNKGSWTLTQQSLDTIAGNITTTERIDWSGANTFTINSEINILTDRDYFKVWLDKGITYDLRAIGSSGGGTLADPQLSLRSATNILLAQDDNGGGGTDAKLAYSAADSGWYYIDVGAAGNASKGTYVLKGSTLADDYANGLLTTGVVQAGSSLQGLISYTGDSDWIKVGLSKGITYVIDLAGDVSDNAQLDPMVDPLLTIRDAKGDVIARYDDFGGSLNSRAYFTPTTGGLYYLEAKSAFKYDIGAYKVTVAQAPADDYAALMSSLASTLTLGQAIDGVIGLPGDRDVFKVSLEVGKVYQINMDGMSAKTKTLADPHLRIFDSAGNLVDFDNNGGVGNDAALYFAPSATGVYYVEASSNNDKGMGNYSVKVVQRNIPVDDVPNNAGTQVFINPGESYEGNLLTNNDQDWFGIRLISGKDYVFRLQASHSGHGSLADPVLEVRDGNGTLIRRVDDMLMGNEPAILFTPASTGTYYLVAKAKDGQVDTGTYTLITRAPDDYSNTKSDAQSISLGQTLEGAIQWSDGAFGVRAYDSIGLASDIDEDWFKFTASANDVLSIMVEIDAGSALSRPLIEIVDSQNRSMAIGDGLETTNGLAVATFKAPDSGTYYARVIDGAGATGAYKISLATGDASDEDTSGAVVLTFSNQGSVVQAQATAKIGLAGDTDDYQVFLQSGHSYRIETLAVRNGSVAPLGSAKLDMSWLAQGSINSEDISVAGHVATPSFFDSTVFEATSSGTLSINVSALDATQTGQYKIKVIDLGAAQSDDRPDSVADFGSAAVLAVNESANGRIGTADDVDLYAVNLTEGNLYNFSIKSYVDGLGTLSEGVLRLLDKNGHLVSVGNFDSASGRTELPVSVFEDGRYYLSVAAADLIGNTGAYVLDTRLLGDDVFVDDIAADTQSGVTASPGRPATGVINYAADHDWIKVSLTAGKVYVLDVLANGAGAGGTLKDATLRLLDSQGNEIAFDDNSGAGSDARLQFSVTDTANYYLDVGSNLAQTGSYTVRVRELYSGEADPLKVVQWYLDASGVTKLNGEITGAGVKIGVVDDGIDSTHPDLQNQLDTSAAYDTQFNSQNGDPKYPTLIGLPPDNHGTLVAGIIAAEANNETGIVGVAPDAELVSTRVKWTWDQITEALSRQWNFDVSNNSWGAISPFSDNFNSTSLTFAWQALRRGVEDGRDGLGTVFVFAAGNSASAGDNTNYHNFQNAREVITVGAAQADGSMASFSTPGANVLVSSYGVDMITTDRHQAGWGENPAGNYVTNFTGTSAAAPMVSGIVALMLEANPELGYRDVQEILIFASTHPDNQDWKVNGASNFNLNGLSFNDKAGFGIVDAYAAVQLAKTWTKESTAINEVSAFAREFDLTDAIPDGNGSVYTRSFTIDGAIKVEHVELGVDLRHTRMGDLVIELTSPDGTVSTLMNRPTVNAEQPFGLSGDDSGVPTHLLWDFSSVQFWGEQASGTWTVSVKDLRAEETGTINSLSLRVYGEREDGNDIYVFTEEGFKSVVNKVLSDDGGTDTINASPMLHDIYIDLGAGVIASQGVTYGISNWTVIENAISGDANDNLVGNKVGNLLNGMDGNDILTGGFGNDILIGGLGTDIARFAGKRADYGISWNSNTRLITVVDNKSSDGNDGTDTLSGVEKIIFSDAEVNLGATVGNRAPTATSTFFDNPIIVNKGIGINFDIPETAFADVDTQTDLAIEVTAASGGELPDWLSYDADTRTFSGVPPSDYQGQLKLLVTAIDEFGATASDTLTLQFGDNQSPIVKASYELVVQEDAGTVSLELTDATDPEGKSVTIKVLELPTFGVVLDKLGNTVSVGTEIAATDLSELHYRTTSDANGNAGSLRYEAKDADGVIAESSVRIYVDAVNDRPRFSTAQTKLTIRYPDQSTVPLDMLKPTDPETTIDRVTLIDLPAVGVVKLDGVNVNLNQVLTFDQLDRLTYTLSENVNGPIGAVTIQATDSGGLSTNWSLALEVQGAAYSNVGTPGDDAIYGSIGDDTLYGMAGSDILAGNAGNDRLLGGIGNDSIFGGSGNDSIDGSSGNDYLDGGAGNDLMNGGPGNDTYFVDSASDTVLEVIATGAGGKDLIVTSITLTAPVNVENLQAAAGVVIDLTGNALDNILSGNEQVNNLMGGAGRDILNGSAGNDTLNGGLGIDRLLGGPGNDTYYVDSRSDLVFELSNEGLDKVIASSNYTLFSHIEDLVLTEGGDYSAAGNSLNNHIIGNSGNNMIAGGLGADTLEGGLGNDIYVLNDNVDLIIDTGGLDTIRSTLDVDLASYNGIENIELIGILDNFATGNASNNSIIGNIGNNILDGRGGADTLTGGDGSDQFVVAANASRAVLDRVTDFLSGTDLLVVDIASYGISPSQLGLSSSGTVANDAFLSGPGARSINSNSRFLYDTATAVLKFDMDGTGSAAAIDLVQLSASAASLKATDIYVVI